MNLILRAASCLTILACLISGCGGTGPPSLPPGEALVAGPNRRIKAPPAYQKMLNKKGEFKLKPGMYEAYKKKQAASGKEQN